MKLHYHDKRLVFAEVDDGSHLVVDRYWYEYMLDRIGAPTPSAVKIFDTTRAVLDAYWGFVKVQTHMTPEERRRSIVIADNPRLT
jgi:hypothetical protein